MMSRVKKFIFDGFRKLFILSLILSSILFLLHKTNTLISSGKFSGKGVAAIVFFFEKNFPNLNLQGSFPYFLHVLECL